MSRRLGEILQHVHADDNFDGRQTQVSELLEGRALRPKDRTNPSRHVTARVLLANQSADEASHQQCKCNDPDKNRAIQIHPCGLVRQVVLYVL